VANEQEEKKPVPSLDNLEKPKEMTEEEKMAQAKKIEQEAVDRMVTRARTAKQMCFMELQGDYFGIY
jgi:hypothetical protein